MSQRRDWDRDSQPGPAWAKNLVRRAYLVETRAEGEQQGEPVVFESSYPCAVGDVVSLPASVLAPHEGGEAWEIVERQAAAAPYTALLIVEPA